MQSQIKHYLYSIARRDIPIAQQAIQAGHAALEYAYQNGRSPDHHPSYIKLTIRNKDELVEFQEYLKSLGIKTSYFNEPYKNWGLTAIACCLSEEQRHLVKNLPLWKPQKEAI